MISQKMYGNDILSMSHLYFINTNESVNKS